MYRFFCTVCKKVKRVQKHPVLLENAEHGNPSMRLGECNKHSNKKPYSFMEKVQAQSRIGRR